MESFLRNKMLHNSLLRNTRINEYLRALGRRGLSLMTSLLIKELADDFTSVSVG